MLPLCLINDPWTPLRHLPALPRTTPHYPALPCPAACKFGPPSRHINWKLFIIHTQVLWLCVCVCVPEGGKYPGGGGTAGKVAGRGRPQLTKFLAKAIRSTRTLLCYYQKKLTGLHASFKVALQAAGPSRYFFFLFFFEGFGSIL